MSAAEDDTELRDLLVQNLENSGVLSRMKAEMRAAVFVAMEDQDRLENKTPLVNENLKKCLNTKDGRLVASLIVDFLQVFNLDFTLAVFQPEINMLNGLDGRDQVCTDLGLSESDLNRNCPLLLELVRRGRDKAAVSSEDPPPKQITNVRKNFERYDKAEDAGSGPGPETPASPPVSKDPDRPVSLGRADVQTSSSGLRRDRVDLDLEGDEDPDEGDSFFDDPLPKPQKTYGWTSEASRSRGSPPGSQSDSPRPGPGPGGSSLSELSLSRNGSESRGKGGKGLSDKTGSLHLDDDVEYDDDFISHRSELSKSDLSIGEEIEEVSIEGPDHSEKFDDTQDLSLSLSQNQEVDYMEDVA